MSSPVARLTALPGQGLIGIGTSKKIGGKPQRNRVKRRFREAIRLQPEIIRPSLDYILIVSTDATHATFDRIEEEVRELFGKAAARWESELESS